MRLALCTTLFAASSLAAAHAAPPPADPLASITNCSAAHETLLASFTLTYVREGSVTFRARYDAEEDHWDMLEEPAGDETQEDREAFAEMREEMRGPGALVADDEFETVSTTSLIEETADSYVYSFVPSSEGDDPMPEKMREAVDTRLAIDKATGCLTDLSIQSTKPFKPAMVAKVDKFFMRYSFARNEDAPLPLFSSFTTEVSGNAMFRQFQEQLQITVSDVVILE